MTTEAELESNHGAALARRHLCWGWCSLLCFLSLGLVLETMHGFKVDWYGNVYNETRRLMLTLAHAHGVLLSLVNVAFGLTILHLRSADTRWRRVASLCLLSASVMLPAGFFLGGVVIYAGDPGPGILLAPAGGLLLFVAVLATAVVVIRAQPSAAG